MKRAAAKKKMKKCVQILFTGEGKMRLGKTIPRFECNSKMDRKEGRSVILLKRQRR
jgi:hypothetical protein